MTLARRRIGISPPLEAELEHVKVRMKNRCWLPSVAFNFELWEHTLCARDSRKPNSLLIRPWASRQWLIDDSMLDNFVGPRIHRVTLSKEVLHSTVFKDPLSGMGDGAGKRILLVKASGIWVFEKRGATTAAVGIE